MQEIPPECDGRVDAELRFIDAGACVVARERGHVDSENSDKDKEQEDNRRRKSSTTIYLKQRM